MLCKQGNDDTKDWIRTARGTPSSQTGPPADHTTNNKGGNSTLLIDFVIG